MSSSTNLTELEGATLALIGRETALTAYEIKEWYRRSPSSYWSGSAGAVYPLMKRLEAAGLVSSADRSTSKRPRRVYRLTQDGQSAMQVWLLDAARASDAGLDPLRTRLAFIAQMPVGEARGFLQQVLAEYDTVTAPSDAPGTIALVESWVDMRRAWIQSWLDRLD